MSPPPGPSPNAWVHTEVEMGPLGWPEPPGNCCSTFTPASQCCAGPGACCAVPKQSSLRGRYVVCVSECMLCLLPRATSGAFRSSCPCHPHPPDAPLQVVWDYAPLGGNQCSGQLQPWSEDEAIFVQNSTDRIGSRWELAGALVLAKKSEEKRAPPARLPP